MEKRNIHVESAMGESDAPRAPPVAARRWAGGSDSYVHTDT
jgi:hypothetical protein